MQRLMLTTLARLALALAITYFAPAAHTAHAARFDWLEQMRIQQEREAQRQAQEDARELLRLQIEEVEARQQMLRNYIACLQNTYPTADDYEVQELQCRREAIQNYRP